MFAFLLQLNKLLILYKLGGSEFSNYYTFTKK